MIERIIYVSEAAPRTGLDEVYGIIRSAHARNGAQGVSGALLYLDGWFAQLIEGPAEAVGETFARIAVDSRHQRLSLRIRATALAPLLRGQPMALRYRGCLDEELLGLFGYRPGFPPKDLPVDTLTEFILAACRRSRHAPVARMR